MSNSQITSEEKELLITLYKEYYVQARHHDNISAAMSRLFLTLGGAVIGGLSLADLDNETNVVLSSFLIAIGVVGAISTLKHAERHGRSATIARRYRNKLDDAYPNAEIKILRDEAKLRNKKRYGGFAVALKTYWMWMSIHILLTAFGCIFLFHQGL